MSAEEATTGRWELTDEEWCELCFMIIDLGSTRDRLEKTLLSEERPTLHQLWLTMSAYRDSSDSLLNYMSSRLRMKAGIEHRQAA